MADNNYSLEQPNFAQLYPGWGINPNYNTPAFDAPYRPAYKGPNPYSAYEKPGFLLGLSRSFNPMDQPPYYGSPTDYQMQAGAAVAGGISDGFMHAAQNWVVPTLMFGLASRAFTQAGNTIGRGFGRGLASGLGMGGRVAAGVAGAGSLIGGIGVPLALGYAASSIADNTIFQPYIQQRQMSETLQDSFRGVTFGGSFGNDVTGRGLSGSQAARMATKITSDGIKDNTFSSNQYSAIGAMGMRAGLFDDVQASNITNRVKQIASQIKTILAISNDPNIQNAIEELAKLRIGGASVAGGVNSTAIGAYRSMGYSAAMAGTSVQRLMNTVGQQGQYMYQAAGLTPYLGQLAAGTGYAGFAQAQRAGLIGAAQLARMGGLEGATQSYTSSLITGSMTSYNQMMLYNQFRGKSGSSVIDVARNFGDLASRNPVGTIGAGILYGKALASNQLKDSSGKAYEDQAIEMLKAQHIAPDGANGYSPEQVAMALRNLGMSDDEIKAFTSARYSATNAATIANNIKAIKAETTDQVHQVISQERLQSGIIDTPKNALIGYAKKVKSWFSDQVGLFNKGTGVLGDMIGNFAMWNEFSSTYNKDHDLDSSLKEVASSMGQNLDRLMVVGQAQNALSDMGSGPGADIEKILAKPQYRALAESLKGKSAQEKLETIRKMAQRSLRAGLYGASSIASRIAMTEEEVMRNPEKFTSDKATLEALKKAGGDRLKVKKIIEGEISRLNGGRITSDRSLNINDNFTAEQYAAISAPLAAESKKLQDINTAAVSGVDYSGYMDTISKIDKESADIQMKAAEMNLRAASLNWEAATGKRTGLFSTNTKD